MTCCRISPANLVALLSRGGILGSVEFECDCGKGRFLSSTDNRSYVAHLIADQDYDDFSEAIDSAIERSGPTARDKDAVCMEWRRFRMPRVWQCPNCGSLYVEDTEGNRHTFRPASEQVSKQLFKRKP